MIKVLRSASRIFILYFIAWALVFVMGVVMMLLLLRGTPLEDKTQEATLVVGVLALLPALSLAYGMATVPKQTKTKSVPLFHYRGPAYVRPMGRGIILEKVELEWREAVYIEEDLADVLNSVNYFHNGTDDGDVLLEVKVYRIKGEGDDEASE